MPFDAVKQIHQKESKTETPCLCRTLQESSNSSENYLHVLASITVFQMRPTCQIPPNRHKVGFMRKPETLLLNAGELQGQQ